MLLLPKPKRLSIDIDIIISKKTENIESAFDKIIQSSDFIKFKEDEREVNSEIEKSHYKFYYKPVTTTTADSEFILLDILYEDSHYGEHLSQIEIESPFVKTEGENTKLTVPIPEAILGDKLTAFAPKTTGVPYERGKEVEIIKQLFDVGHLFDMIKNIDTVKTVFNQFAKTETSYRNLDANPEVVLNDILETAIVLATRGKTGNGNFKELQTGIQNIKNYIFSENFHIERAMIPAAKAAYLSAILQSETKEIHRFNKPSEIANWTIEQPFETRLNKLKKTSAEAFFYWYKTFELTIEIK